MSPLRAAINGRITTAGGAAFPALRT